jgi:hypothetical protein
MLQEKSKPWLQNKDWKDNQIRSNAKFSVYIIWGFAIVWNLISTPILFTSNNLLNDIAANPAKALVLMFPAIGVLLIFVAINALKNWNRFGPTPLVMDPFPGSIGGHVGGTIENNVGYDSRLDYRVTLTCFYSYMSGSGKDRSRREKVEWQTEGVCFSAPTNNVDPGTKISFRFDIPDNLSESDEKNSSSYHLWRVNITCELPGTDFDRSFEIPVFKGAHESQHITSGTEDYHRTMDVAHDGLYEIAQITPIAGGMEFYYPPLKRPTGGIMACLFGSIFTGIGIVLSQVDDAPIIFPIVFTPIGLGILFIGIWELGKSLRVKLVREDIFTRRFFMKYPITSKQVATSQVRSLEIKEGSSVSNGKKTTIYYSLVAHTSNRKKIVLAERLNSKPEVELIKETIEPYCPNLVGGSSDV